MATQRKQIKGKTSSRPAVRPNEKAAKPAVAVDAPVVRRATPAELRAEQEPAVEVADAVVANRREGKGLEGKGAMDDWAPPPQRTGWWQKLCARMGRKREARAEMAEHMAAVKAGVLHELETLGAKKGVAVKGSPFATVLLPVARPKRGYAKWWAVAAVALAMVGIIFWVGRGTPEPDTVLAQAMAAVRNNDVRTFETRVDVASVATSVVNQMFNVPNQDGIAAKMTAFAKPGLADGLKDEILVAVQGERLDDSGNTLLGRLWHALGERNVRFGAPMIARKDERVAVAEVPLIRQDLGLTLPLQVELTRDGEGADWQVTDITNLAPVLDSIGEAERVLAERRMRAAQAAATPAGMADIRVESVKKAKDSSAGSSNIIVSMVLANVGTLAAKDVPLDVAFGDAAGQPMMTTRVTLEGDLAAGARREQVWSVPIDRARAAERYVADLPLSALTVTVTPAQE